MNYTDYTDSSYQPISARDIAEVQKVLPYRDRVEQLGGQSHDPSLEYNKDHLTSSMIQVKKILCSLQGDLNPSPITQNTLKNRQIWGRVVQNAARQVNQTINLKLRWRECWLPGLA